MTPDDAIQRHDIGHRGAVDPELANPTTRAEDDQRTPRQRNRDARRLLEQVGRVVSEATAGAEAPKPLSRQNWMNEPRPDHLTDIDDINTGRGPRSEQ